MTAMRRPGIIRDTLDSFARNLKGVDLCESTLHLNIDPLPEEGELDEVVAVADEYFAQVIVNLPAQASFPAAVKWCWSRPSGEFFFSTEDDWVITDPVNVEEMHRLLLSDPTLSCVNLRAYPHNDDRICLAPGLWRTEHAKLIERRMTTDANPERQLRQADRTNPCGDRHVGFKGIQYPEKIVLRDIGRAWLAQMPYHRAGGKKFTAWARA